MKFDLKSYDEAYFTRLKDFIDQAGKRGVVVELSLFCAIYNDKLWDLNPMKADNNVNGVGKGGRLDVYNLKDRELTDIQEALVRKIVSELKNSDNVYYEICNEPYFGGVTKEWNDRIAGVIADAEKGLPARHLDRAEHLQRLRRGERPEPERRRPELPLLLAAGRRGPELRPRPARRLRRDGFPRHGRPALPHRRLGLPHRRRRRLQQPRLFLQRLPPRRHAQGRRPLRAAAGRSCASSSLS